MKAIVKYLILLVTSFILTSCCNTYNKVLTKSVRDALGPDYKSYQTFSYPTNNYGLITSYANEQKDENFICDMWNCLGVEDTKIPSVLEQQLRMKEYAAVGDNGATIIINETQQKEFALKVMLPEIYKILKLDGNVSDKQTITTSIELGQAYPRKLRRKPMIEFINSLAVTDPMKQAYAQGNLLMVVSDVIITSIKTKISVDDKLDSSLIAALADADASGKIFKGAKLELKMTRQKKGDYTFETTKPVIVMRLSKKQPMAGVLGAEEDNDWKDWIITK